MKDVAKVIERVERLRCLRMSKDYFRLGHAALFDGTGYEGSHWSQLSWYYLFWFVAYKDLK